MRPVRKSNGNLFSRAPSKKPTVQKVFAGFAVLLLLVYLGCLAYYKQPRGGNRKIYASLELEWRSLQDSITSTGARASEDHISKFNLESVPPLKQTLRFKVCNGFANQRLSLFYGIFIAVQTGRSPVLPVLIGEGTQLSGETILANFENEQPFNEVYNQDYFLKALASHGIRALQEHESPAPRAYTDVKLFDLGYNIMEPLRNNYRTVDHLAIDCPLFKVLPSEVPPEMEQLVWTTLDSLLPSQRTAPVVNAAVRTLSQQSEKYNFLHLRMENDWVAHCERWSAINDGIVRDNCYNNTEQIDVPLRIFGFQPDVPLYVASYWHDVDPKRNAKVMALLAKANYKVFTSKDILAKVVGLGREQLALIEYYIGLRSSRFLGNSVSTFAALALLERRHHSRWAAYYNGGNVPIAQYLPIHKMPWVFTYNSWSVPYDYMLKAAVRSAAKFNSMRPYCIFSGNSTSSIYHWLVSMNVTMISHTPVWRDELVAKAQLKMKDNIQHSHLYKTPDMLVSTFQRVDLPVVPILDQYTYVLYTDADVYFRRRITLEDFGLPLPRSVSMSYEFQNMFPYNAGIILANLPTMRRHYKDFIATMLNNNDGLYYPNFGPADQGILNKYYESDIRGHMLNQAFNTKPYNDMDPVSFLIHFHGPKPHEYVKFLETGQCDFYYVCEQAFLKALCQYAREWMEFIPEEPVASHLGDACLWLSNPTIIEVFKKKWGLTVQPQPIPENEKQAFVHADEFRDHENHEQKGQNLGQAVQVVGQVDVGQ